MNKPIVFLPHALRDLNAERKHRQFSKLRQWLFKVLKRPLIAEPPKAQVFEIKNPTQWKLERVRRRARESL